MKTQLELNIRSRGAMSGVLTMGSLDPAFAAATGVDGEPVVVDLRTVEFVEPAGLCALAALLEYLCARCEVVNLALAGRDVPAYLERMNFFRSFGERVCANAAEHGVSSFGAYAAVQAYHHIVSGSRRRGEEVLIAIADGGVGVRETLTRNPEYAQHTTTDNDALRHALEMGVSATGEIGRGG